MIESLWLTSTPRPPHLHPRSRSPRAHTHPGATPAGGIAGVISTPARPKAQGTSGMAHSAQQLFFTRLRDRFPHYFTDVRVLEIGSLDVNGNLRHLFTSPVWYTGIDLAPGPNVDVVSPAHLFDFPCCFDTILSAETLEHDLYYVRSLENILRLLRPGGLLAISCATTGRPEHGTSKSHPEDAPFLSQMSPTWADYYRNLTESDLRPPLSPDTTFESYEFQVNPIIHDLYFWGIKRSDF